MTTIRGVLLDVDGTLIDSNDAHAHAWVKALAAHGLHAPFAEVRRCIGLGGDKLLPQVANIAEDSSLGKKVGDSRARIFQTEYLPRLKPFQGATALLQRLKSDGFHLAVASSAKKQELSSLLQICGATDLIEAKTSSDDVDNSKPDPDIVLAALDRIGVSADESVLLGDTPYDLEACNKAGVAFIGFRCGGSTDKQLAGALAIYDHADDLLAHYSSSPFVS